MNIHLITYLTSKFFWIYTVYRYHDVLYAKNESKQKIVAYFCAYLLCCWGSMKWGTIYGDFIFEFIALLIISIGYYADLFHYILNTFIVYILGILCDGIPMVLFQRYMEQQSFRHQHAGPGIIVMGNFIFFLLELVIERKANVKRSYRIKSSHWLAMLSIPIISIIICIIILMPKRRIIRPTMVLFLLFINVFIFYLYDEIQKGYMETAKQEQMKIQVERYAKELDVMIKSQNKLDRIYHDYKHHLTAISAMAKSADNKEILVYLNQLKETVGSSWHHHCYTQNHTINNILNYILENAEKPIKNLKILVDVPNYIGEELFDISIIVGNLMDNAIRGAAHSEEQELLFKMYYKKGIMKIETKNSIKDLPKIQNGHYQTTKSKKDGHGIGLQNIKLIADKYDGQLCIDYTEQYFKVTLCLYMLLEER